MALARLKSAWRSRYVLGSLSNSTVKANPAMRLELREWPRSCHFPPGNAFKDSEPDCCDRPIAHFHFLFFLILIFTSNVIARHRRNFVCNDGDLSPPLLKVMVTVTTIFSKWNLYFGQENRIFLATRSVLWPKICRKCDRGRGSASAGERTPVPIPHPTRRL